MKDNKQKVVAFCPTNCMPYPLKKQNWFLQQLQHTLCMHCVRYSFSLCLYLTLLHYLGPGEPEGREGGGGLP